MFYQNYSLVLHSYSSDILKINFKKSLDLDLKNLGLPYWAGVNFTTYWAWGWKILELPCQTEIWLINITIRLEKYLDYLGFELVLRYIGLELNTWTWISYWTQTDFITAKHICCWKSQKTYLIIC